MDRAVDSGCIVANYAGLQGLVVQVERETIGAETWLLDDLLHYLTALLLDEVMLR